MKRNVILITVFLCLLSLAVVLSPPDVQAAGVTWYVDDDYVSSARAPTSRPYRRR